MSIVTGLNRLIDLFIETFRQMGRGRIWALLFIWLFLNVIVLIAHYDFTSPLFSGVMSLWSKLFGEQRATGFMHYPGHFLLMPDFFSWARFGLGTIIEGLLLGGIAVAFHDGYTHTTKEDRTTLRSLMPLWIHLTIGWLLINGLAVAFNVFLPNWLDSFLRYSPRRQLLFYYAILPGIYMVLLAIFYLVIARIAIYRETIFRALKRSLRMFIHNPFTFLILSVLLLIVPSVISIILSRPDIIVDKFRPELVFWLILAGLLVDLLVYFVWIGTAVKFLHDEER